MTQEEEIAQLKKELSQVLERGSRDGGATEQGWGTGKRVSKAVERHAGRKSCTQRAIGEGEHSHRGTGEAENAPSSLRQSEQEKTARRADEGAQKA
jgi:hypothetical protein